MKEKYLNLLTESTYDQYVQINPYTNLTDDELYALTKKSIDILVRKIENLEKKKRNKIVECGK